MKGIKISFCRENYSLARKIFSLERTKNVEVLINLVKASKKLTLSRAQGKDSQFLQ